MSMKTNIAGFFILTAFGVLASTTAVVVPGGSRTYTTASDWMDGSVPDGYDVNVIVDNDPSKTTTLNLNGKGTICTNGFLRIDEGDGFSIYASSKDGSTFSLYSTCVTNYGTIAFGKVKKNGQNYHLNALQAPSYNGSTGRITIDTSNYQGSTHRMVWLTDGSVNDGTIIVSTTGAQYQYANFYLQGGGTFVNNGEIRLTADGSYASGKPGNTSLEIRYGHSALSGTGSVTMDLSGRATNGTQTIVLKGPSLLTNLVNDTSHSIVGEGIIDNCRLINRGLLKSKGTNYMLRVRIPDRRTTAQCVTNEASGRIVADSAKGILFMGMNLLKGTTTERSGWNANFISLGLLEARTGSQIAFSDGVNSTSSYSGERDLGATADYLKFWGRVAGGGQFKTIRPIHIMEDAVLAPGDLANDNGTGASTCGTLTFTTNLVMEAGAVAEFQCRKPVAGRFDSVWVNGNLTVAGKLKFTAKPGGGTYRLFTATGALTCDLQALTIECAEGVSEPKLKLVDSTYEVEEEVVDEGSGDVGIRKVSYPCKGLEATWVDGFLITIM